MDHIKHIFTPNKSLDKRVSTLLIFSQVTILILYWFFASSVFLPTPSEVASAFSKLWREGFYQHLIVSLKLNFEAIFIAAVISLALAYLTVLPFFRPLVAFISKLRFLSLIGLSFIFSLSASGHNLKVSILVFSISVYFITSMADVLSSIPKVQFDLARTLKMNESRVVWEVIVLGQIDKVFDVIRQNAAIGLLMLTVVEGLVRTEGGIGSLLVNSNKHFQLSSMMSIQMVFLMIGLGQDYVFMVVKNIVCPYASLTTEKK